jgi:uncharacterized membrane protein
MAAIGSFVFLFRPAPAVAEFAVCNATTYGTVSVAWAATWNDSNGSPYGEAQGWYNIAPDDCKIMITTTDISAYTIYIYGKAMQNPSGQFWGGDYKFCLEPTKKFKFQGNAMMAPCAAGSVYGMRAIVTGGTSTYAYFLRD